MPKELIITKPDDLHLHLRDGKFMADVVLASAKQVSRAIIMPNLVPPIVNAQQALAYQQRILAQVPHPLAFKPLMTLYLTNQTSKQDISQAKAAGIRACKLYPAGATTNSENGVTDIVKIYPILETMQEQGMILLLHGEVVEPQIDIFDREKVFIEQVLIPLRNHLPELKIVFEHLTTKEATDYVLAADDYIAATFTPQHLLFNRNTLLSGGLRPHLYCLPILKAQHHQQALVVAATSGNHKFFMGTDSAPHSKNSKENHCCCAGCYSAPLAIELYAQIFEQQDKLTNLEAFTSFHGADFYGLPRNQERIKLVKQSWQVPHEYPYGDESIVPLMAGKQLDWQLISL